MKILIYLCLIYKTWVGVLGTISLLLGIGSHFITIQKIPTRSIGRYLIAASCIGLFYSGFVVWNDCDKKLADLNEPHFDYYGGQVFYGVSNAHKGQIFILCDGLISNKYGASASIIGWSLKLTLKNGQVIQGIMVPNVPNDRQVTIYKNGDTIVASHDSYLPELTFLSMKPGDSRAGWLWALLPISADELINNMPAKLYIGYVDSYSGKLSETNAIISKENLGNAVLSNKNNRTNSVIRTDKIRR
jgi:hypothetical protein